MHNIIGLPTLLSTLIDNVIVVLLRLVSILNICLNVIALFWLDHDVIPMLCSLCYNNVRHTTFILQCCRSPPSYFQCTLYYGDVNASVKAMTNT